MELISSTINIAWKLSVILSLIGCLIMLLFLNQTNQHLSFSLVLTNLTNPNPTTNKPGLNPSFNNDNQTVVKSNVTIAGTTNKPGLNPSFNNDNQTVVKSNVTIAGHIEISRVTSSSSGDAKTNDGDAERECDMFEGRWVYNEDEVRMYDSSTCRFLEEKMSCRRNGRPDFEYEKWTWVPTHCNLPLFNGRDMLERLRNKRVIIVGDSLNRNMWESLACLLYTSIPSSRAHVQASSSTYKLFKAMDYNCIIEFHWSPFLIKLNEHHENGKKVLVLDEPSPSSIQWQGADVMVFNSGHWWMHMARIRSWDLFEYEGKLVDEMPIEVAYERGMKTWAKWVETNVNPKKTTVFFRSVSPEHYREQWCYNVTQPTFDESFKSSYPESLIDIVKGIIKDIKKLKVEYLDITKLSSYRRDAHPSVYRSSDGESYTTQNRSVIQAYADCSHWCLPGLPDTWNRLLYSSLFFNSSRSASASSSYKKKLFA